jgi:aspartyl-tRNA(Asn)/glutamyl-tRNA(Gln) amidotransferase subunit A
VFGIKPTYGLVPLFPASPYGTLAHVGPISWTVRDSALALDVLSGSDSRDWTAGPRPERPMTANLRAGVSGMRIAYSPRLGFATVDPEVAGIVRTAVQTFTDLGARVEIVDPAISDPVLAFHVLWFAGAAASITSLTGEQRARLDPGLLEACEEGATRSALDYVAATAVRAELGRIMGEFHEHFDLLLTPTMPIPAFEAGVEVPPGSPHERWTGWTPFTYPFNMTQQPAASLPCGFTAAGLPVGLQVVGPKYADARVLTACRAFEQARPWQGSRPALG